MSNETKHTPTPYHVSGESYGNYITVTGANGRVVCRVPWGKPGTEYDGETAKFIARACTVHDELYKLLAEWVAFNTDTSNDTENLVVRTRLALAKARGE